MVPNLCRIWRVSPHSECIPCGSALCCTRRLRSPSSAHPAMKSKQRRSAHPQYRSCSLTEAISFRDPYIRYFVGLVLVILPHQTLVDLENVLSFLREANNILGIWDTQVLVPINVHPQKSSSLLAILLP